MIVSDKDPHLAGLIYFIDRAKEIAVFTNAVFDSIAEIAAGNLKKAILYVENSLAKAISPAISFLASMAGIGGIVRSEERRVGKECGFWWARCNSKRN